MVDTRFQKGREKTGGRGPSIKTQLKRFEEKHPEAYDELMEVLFKSGKDGHSLDAQYVIDRIKGKPKAVVGLAEEEGKALAALAFVELCKLQDAQRKQLQEGTYAIEQVQEPGEDEASPCNPSAT